MAFERYVDGFDQCESPICPDDVNVEITDWLCRYYPNKLIGLLRVYWTVTNTYNRSLSRNRIRWQFLNKSTGKWTPYQPNRADAYNHTQPYWSQANIYSFFQPNSGTMRFQVEVVISNTSFTTNWIVINTQDCFPTQPEQMVKANFCDCVPPLAPVNYDLYVKDTGVFEIPSYFKYDNKCWYVDQDAWDNKRDVDPGAGTIIDFIYERDDTVYTNCNPCCMTTECPSEWEAIDNDVFVAKLYIVYNTVQVRDRIVVIRNFNEDIDCIIGLDGLPQTRILWDSDCVGTMRRSGVVHPDNIDCDNRPCEDEGEGWGEYITSDEIIRPRWVPLVNWFDARWQFSKELCITIYSTDLPIGVIVDLDCENEGYYTPWCYTILGPDGMDITDCGGDPDENVCGDIIIPSPSSSKSSSSSSLSQSSSKSSSSVWSSSRSSSRFSSSRSSSKNSSSTSSSQSSSRNSSSSQSSSRNSSSSKSSSKSSSASSESQSSSASSYHHFVWQAFIMDPYTEEQLKEIYKTYEPELKDLSNTEKEDLIIRWVSEGEISAYIAVYIAREEGLDIET